MGRHQKKSKPKTVNTIQAASSSFSAADEAAILKLFSSKPGLAQRVLDAANEATSNSSDDDDDESDLDPLDLATPDELARIRSLSEIVDKIDADIAELDTKVTRFNQYAPILRLSNPAMAEFGKRESLAATSTRATLAASRDSINGQVETIKNTIVTRATIPKEKKKAKAHPKKPSQEPEADPDYVEYVNSLQLAYYLSNPMDGKFSRTPTTPILDQSIIDSPGLPANGPTSILSNDGWDAIVIKDPGTVSTKKTLKPNPAVVGNPKQVKRASSLPVIPESAFKKAAPRTSNNSRRAAASAASVSSSSMEVTSSKATSAIMLATNSLHESKSGTSESEPPSSSFESTLSADSSAP